MFKGIKFSTSEYFFSVDDNILVVPVYTLLIILLINLANLFFY